MNTSEETNIPASRFFNTFSRYKNSSIVYYTMGTRKVLTVNTYKKQVDSAIKDTDLFSVVSAGEEYRPDLVSYKAYGTPSFWWKILEANNIKDIFDFKAGTNIRIPQNLY